MMIRKISLGGLIVGLLFACDNNSKKIEQTDEKGLFVNALIETKPVQSSKDQDAADDPAIWVNRESPSESKIIGTNKKAGLAVYNLKGERIQFLPVGNVNNVDIRYDLSFKDTVVDYAVASNRSGNFVTICTIESGSGMLENAIGDTIFPEITEVYGICLYVSPKDNKHYMFINGKEGEVEQYLLTLNGQFQINGEKVRAFQINSQPEGMVADDSLGLLYIGEENKGIWKYGAEPDDQHKSFIKQSGASNSDIEFDIEGITLYYGQEESGYLIASSQGNNRFVVFTRKDNKYLGYFGIAKGDIDGVEETDGIDVCHLALGDLFPKGIFVAQDGFNYDGEDKKNQNFKFVPWQNIAHLFDPALIIND